jgi:hypothetical protein
MSKETVFKNLEELYNNKKARNFFNHLVRSYFPSEKVEPVFVKANKDFNCVITRMKLSSVNQVLDGFDSKELKDELFSYIHNMLKSEVEPNEKLKEFIGDKQIAVQGEKTTTYMSAGVYMLFESWLLTKMSSGDKHIGWLLKDYKKENTVKKKKTNKKMDTKNTVKPKKESYGGRATFALGDLQSLKELKDKLNKGNK